MKKLIKKILREQVENDSMRRIRIVLNSMKSHKGWEEFLQQVKSYKKDPPGMWELRESLFSILKLVGGSQDNVQSDRFEKTYWFATVFMGNGGYDRNFKEGEIKLIELPTYDMEANYTEEVYEFRTGWGTIVGVDTDEEAIELFQNNPEDYIEDSETGDSDYGDIYDVEDVIIQNTGIIKFLPHWVGLR